MASLLERGLTSDSAWLRETALRSCRVLSAPSAKIAWGIRRQLYQRYGRANLYRDFSLYCVLFAFPKHLSILLNYLKTLRYATWMQIGAYAISLLFLVLTRDVVALAFLSGTFALAAALGFLSVQSESMRLPFPTLIGILLRLRVVSETGRALSRFKETFSALMKEIAGIWLVLPIVLWMTLLWADVFDSFSFDSFLKTLLRMLTSEYWRSSTLVTPAPLQVNIVSILQTLQTMMLWLFYLARIGFVPIALGLLNVLMFYLVSYYPSRPADWLLLPARFAGAMIRYALKLDKRILIAILALCVGYSWFVLSFIFLSAAGWSLKELHYRYDVPSFLLILVGLWPLLFLLDIAVAFLGATINLARSFLAFVRDQGTIRSLSLRAGTRPRSALEAIQTLRSLRSHWGRQRFVRILPDWVPVGTDWETLVGVAEQYEGSIRDELYKLAEIWQDSQRAETSS